MKVCAIVLAAGRSVRMGTQKLLLPYGNKTVITHIVDQVLASPVKSIITVIGCDGEEIREALCGRDVSFAENPDPESDMLDSIRHGLRALPKGCDAALIVLGDQPGISSDLIAGLRQSFKENEAGIIAPVHKNKRGHPLLVSSQYFQELLSDHDGVGLQGLLAAHPDEVSKVTVTDATALTDLDTPEDYRRHLAGKAV